MRLWADVYDVSGNRLGDGPVTTIKSATVSRALDGAGQFGLSIVGIDPRALDLMQPERRVQIFVEDTGGVRILGEGIVVRRNLYEIPSGVGLSVDGPDILNELKRRNTLLARIYNQETLSDIIDDLIALVPGWTATVDAAIASDVLDARFDGVSILKSLQEINKRYGYHFRVSNAGSRIVEISNFGENNGLRVHGTEVVTQELLANPDVLTVERIRTSENSEGVVNWIIPLGAGEGIAALTLEHSTRTTPYTIQSMAGPDGTTLYYISDSTSVTTFGEIQKVVQFKEVAALSNTDVDIENAANALYDAAANWLSKYVDVREMYSVTVHNVKESVLPGDKIHLNYQAQVKVGSELVDYLSVRGDFYVMRLTETASDGGSSVSMEISNVDRKEESMAAVVVSSIEAIETRNLKPLSTSIPLSYVYAKELAPDFEVAIPVEITHRFLFLQTVRLRLKTTPFRATAKSARSGGSSSITSITSEHLHTWASLLSDDPPENTYVEKEFFAVDRDGLAVWFKLPTTIDYPSSGVRQVVAIAEFPNHTHPIDIPDHEHDLLFEITDDDQTPIGVTVLVNGSDKTLELFGSSVLAPSGGNINLVADEGALVDAIRDTSSTIYQEHQITVRCQDGQGSVEATVEIFGVTQSTK